MRRTLLAGLALASGCGLDAGPDAEFQRLALPVLQARCADVACHGVAPDAEARGEVIDWDRLHLRLDDDGRIADPAQARAASLRHVNTREPPEFSSLLRKPLAVAAGGVGHLGGGTFWTLDDPDLARLRAWIDGETAGGEDPTPLDPLEQLFADTVQPALVEGTCFTARCHGPTAGGVPYALDPGVDGRFSIAATRHNYRQSLRLLALDGVPEQSRLLRKAQALDRGILHKGLNFDFFAGNPGGGEAAIRAWACAERRARAGVDCAPPATTTLTGVVFVRGPIAPAHAFDLQAFTPGTDLYLARIGADGGVDGAPVNLTGHLHPAGAADVRDPAVSRDGRRLLFAMRTAADEGHHLWLLDLVTGEARQLTHGNRALPGGGLATDRDPAWGPDDTVWFASTRAGVVADQGQLLDAELYSLTLATGERRRWTHTPHVERRPVFLDTGEEAGGEVAFSALRDGFPGQARAHAFRFPPSQTTEYHQHFGITPIATLVHELRELPDGRYVVIVDDLPGWWSAGALGVVERNFGPELNARAASAEPALERYAPPLVLLDGGRGFRDPAPLADGRVLVARHPGPFDPQDPSATFTPRIELLELAERADGGGPRLARASVLLEEPGVALSDPEPIWIRAPIRLDDPPLAADAPPTAVLRHQGVPIVEALLANLAPSGRKVVRDDLAAIRLVEHLPLVPADRRSIDPAETLAGEHGATTVGLGRHGPARILAEVPLAADGSVHLELPAGVAFRIQTLDAAGMAIGAPHDRWFYALPGQILAQGLAIATRRERYGSRCAACHGDLDGARTPPAHEDPDTLTGASLTLARYERQHPRHPLPPRPVGSGRIAIDFVADVAPILARRCERCHGGEAPAAGLDLSSRPTAHFTRAYEHLLAPGTGSAGGRAYVDVAVGRARHSFLVELLTGRELDAPRPLARAGLPHPADAPLTAEELTTMVRWIELGATFRGAVP